MSSIDHIKSHLEVLRSIRGVENIFLAQRDGYPITSAGVWLTTDEIFGVASAASAIFAVARRLHQNLNYALIEGERAKFLIVAFPGDSKYFLTLTTQATVNLGSVLQYTTHCAEKIRPYLTEADYLPPLRSYEAGQEQSILDGFDATTVAQVTNAPSLTSDSLILTETVVTKLRELLYDFKQLLTSVRYTFISTNGGYPIATAGLTSGKLGVLCAFTFALYDTCRKVAWLTKRMHIDQVTIDFGSEHHFVYSTGLGIFSTTLPKTEVRLGFLRLLIPTFTTRIKATLQTATQPASVQSRPPLEGFINSLLSNTLSTSSS